MYPWYPPLLYLIRDILTAYKFTTFLGLGPLICNHPINQTHTRQPKRGSTAGRYILYSFKNTIKKKIRELLHPKTHFWKKIWRQTACFFFDQTAKTLVPSHRQNHLWCINFCLILETKWFNKIIFVNLLCDLSEFRDPFQELMKVVWRYFKIYEDKKCLNFLVVLNRILNIRKFCKILFRNDEILQTGTSLEVDYAISWNESQGQATCNSKL